jgi:hypothetical protein
MLCICGCQEGALTGHPLTLVTNLEFTLTGSASSELEDVAVLYNSWHSWSHILCKERAGKGLYYMSDLQMNFNSNSLLPQKQDKFLIIADFVNLRARNGLRCKRYMRIWPSWQLKGFFQVSLQENLRLGNAHDKFFFKICIYSAHDRFHSKFLAGDLKEKISNWRLYKTTMTFKIIEYTVVWYLYYPLNSQLNAWVVAPPHPANGLCVTIEEQGGWKTDKNMVTL